MTYPAIRGEWRGSHNYQKLIQSGGTSGSPTISDPVYVGPHNVADNAHSLGPCCVVSGASGAGAYVLFSISHPHDIQEGNAYWCKWTNGDITFAAAPNGAVLDAKLESFAFNVVGLILVSWAGETVLEVSL